MTTSAKKSDQETSFFERIEDNLFCRELKILSSSTDLHRIDWTGICCQYLYEDATQDEIPLVLHTYYSLLRDTPPPAPRGLIDDLFLLRRERSTAYRQQSTTYIEGYDELITAALPLCASFALRGVSPDDFYLSLWTAILHQENFEPHARSLTLFGVSNASVIPYYRVKPVLYMSNEDIQKALDDTRWVQQDGRSAFVGGYKSLSEMASHFLDALLLLETKPQRVAMLSALLFDMNKLIEQASKSVGPTHE